MPDRVIKEVKNMLGRKGQGAMEYLMTYGWAILVVMIVGIVMWQLGIFNITGGATTSTGFAKIKPQLAGIGVTHLGPGTMIFTNGAGTRIDIISVRISDLTEDRMSCIVPSNQIAPLKEVGAGELFRISGPLVTGLSCTGSARAGDIWNTRVRIIYRISIGGITSTHTDTGTLRGPRE